ncbi:unnamed protein product, partial [Polarella glacialis]
RLTTALASSAPAPGGPRIMVSSRGPLLRPEAQPTAPTSCGSRPATALSSAGAGHQVVAGALGAAPASESSISRALSVPALPRRLADASSPSQPGLGS